MSEEIQDQDVTKLLAVWEGDKNDKMHGPLNNQEEENKDIPEFIRLKEEGNGLYKNNQFEDALAKYDEAFEHANDEKQVAALLHNKGATYEKMNNMDKALEMYGEAIAKRPGYVRGHQRRCRLLSTMGRYLEAMKDIVETSVSGIKPIGATPEDPTEYLPFDVLAAKVLMELISVCTETQLGSFFLKRNSTSPLKRTVESFLRLYFADPVPRIWRGIDLIADGNADHQIGCNAAPRDSKLNKSANIENPKPTATPAFAYILPKNVVWSFPERSVNDLKEIIESLLAGRQMQSSAALELALRYNVCCRGRRENLQNVFRTFETAKFFWIQHPDVFYHGTLALVHKGLVEEGLKMLELGIRIFGTNCFALMRALFWAIEYRMYGEDSDDRRQVLLELRRLEQIFYTQDRYAMQAEMICPCGGNRYGPVHMMQPSVGPQRRIWPGPANTYFSIKYIRPSLKTSDYCILDLDKFCLETLSEAAAVDRKAAAKKSGKQANSDSVDDARRWLVIKSYVGVVMGDIPDWGVLDAIINWR